VAHLFSTLCGGLWSLVFCLFSVSWVMPYSVMEMLIMLEGTFW
jgi:hypothetical protein